MLGNKEEIIRYQIFGIRRMIPFLEISGSRLSARARFVLVKNDSCLALGFP